MFTVENQTNTGMFLRGKYGRASIFPVSEPLAARLVSLLTPGAAQLLVHPIDEAFLFQDRAGTIPVTADGQTVGRILDATGGGRHLTAVSDPARGTFRRSGRHRWIEFNGTNTAYQADALPAPGVDKAQVFAAVRKNSDSSGRVVSELSAAVAANPGAFTLSAPESTVIRYASISRGSATASPGQRADVASAGAAPDTCVLGATHDIAGDLSVIRRNGVAGTNAIGEKGTGNFNASGTYPLNVGARNGASLFFNGNLYGALITRFSGANLSVETITAVETLFAAEIAGAP